MKVEFTMKAIHIVPETEFEKEVIKNFSDTNIPLELVPMFDGESKVIGFTIRKK